jgi:peptide-methionine (S)-S-oxide reductase
MALEVVMLRNLAVIVVAGLVIAGLAYVLIQSEVVEPQPLPTNEPPPAGSEQATFGGGCFWCTEAVFQKLKGVYSVVPGYAGGSVKNPTYEQVCRGDTGHAEVIQITFDPTTIGFPDLLEVFWQTHNPTTRNRQGPDVGSQYRSVILYHSPEQKDQAERYLQKLDASGAFDAPLVTEILPFTELYVAEAKHHNFYVNNPRQAYCVRVIGPKMEKFEKVFKAKLREPAEQK